MARDDDEQAGSGTPKTWLEPRNLEPLSVAELGAYIAALQSEIERANQAITAKQSHRSGAEALFKKT